jgi:hypothetical protein
MPQAVFVPAQLNDLAVDVQLTSVAQGDLLYRGASKWNNLAKPSAAGSLLRGGTTPAWATNALLDGNGQLQLSAAGPTGGILLGGDVQIYRSAENVAYIPDSLEVKPTGATPTMRFRGGADPSKTVAISTDSSSYGWELSPTGATDDSLLQILGQSFGAGASGEFGVYLGAAGYFRIKLRSGTELARVTQAGQLELPIQGSAGGLLLGGDVQLYRSSASVLHVPEDLDLKPINSTPVIRFRAGADPTKTVAIRTDSSSYGWELAPYDGSTETLIQLLGQSFGGGQGGELGVYLGANGYFKVVQRGGSELMRVTRPGQLELPVQGSTGGLVIGTDVNLYRSGANLLKTDDKLLAAAGIGVGNSASATSPGSVVKKIEVFDASGSSLGYVAVYDAIS